MQQRKFPIRLLNNSDDNDVGRFTEFSSICYSDRAAKGVDYLPAGQDEETTRRRIENREVWVAELDGRIVASFSIASPENTAGSWWYRQPAVVELNQLAVHPDFRILGLFSMMMDAAEQRALELGAVEIAGTVPAKRKKLLQAYLRRGTRIVDYKWKKNARYGSVIFSKALRPPGRKSSFLRRTIRKFKYFRRYLRYGLFHRP
jgi:GNAT superfamily N-acetyltransferase